MEEEQWKAVIGYEGLYEVSNLGQVRSTKRKTTKGGLLKLNLMVGGYLEVTLCKDGKTTRKYLHRLVAEHFLEKTDDKQTYIDHINGIKTDNRKSNLRWVTHSQNMCNTKMRNNNSSGFTGVVWRKNEKMWFVEIRVNGKRYYGGYFRNLEDAVAKRKEMELEYHGEYAFKKE